MINIKNTTAIFLLLPFMSMQNAHGMNNMSLEDRLLIKDEINKVFKTAKYPQMTGKIKLYEPLSIAGYGNDLYIKSLNDANFHTQRDEVLLRVGIHIDDLEDTTTDWTQKTPSNLEMTINRLANRLQAATDQYYDDILFTTYANNQIENEKETALNATLPAFMPLHLLLAIQRNTKKNEPTKVKAFDRYSVELIGINPEISLEKIVKELYHKPSIITLIDEKTKQEIQKINDARAINIRQLYRNSADEERIQEEYRKNKKNYDKLLITQAKNTVEQLQTEKIASFQDPETIQGASLLNGNIIVARCKRLGVNDISINK